MAWELSSKGFRYGDSGVLFAKPPIDVAVPVTP